MSQAAEAYWRRCSNCKAHLGFNTIYWVCNVSTCNRQRTGLIFCSVDCWDAHLPMVRHKEAWAEERRSPKSADATDSDTSTAETHVKQNKSLQMKTTSFPKAAGPFQEAGATRLKDAPGDEILVVASKVKAYIQSRGGLNTSAQVMAALSERVRQVCDDAIRSAHKNERKTVLDRDVPGIRRT
ncbi:MAG: hypothetical protein R3C68_08765 [Myxococcota bacterium]